ncbi:MAG: sodium:proton antiporter [Pseudomonadota bacterium]
MHILEAILILLAVALGLTLLARTLEIPSAVMLVLGGIALAFVPGTFHIALKPELALALFLPPLLQASALRTDWTMFRANIIFIVLLAFGAVLFTAGAVAMVTRELIPGISWPAAIALGAIVAPPDAVAAASVLKRFKLPKRIVAVLEGESLINDASALVLYRFAVGATVASVASVGTMASSFALIALIGTAVGVATGFGANWLMRRLKDKHLEIVVSFLAAFAAYLIAERIEGSGVLAAVACGGLIGRAQVKLAATTRLEGASAWQLVEFVLASLVFLLVGLQLHGILARLEEYSGWHLAMLGLGLSATLIVSRFVWVFATFYPATALVAVLRGGKFTPSLSYPTIISWTGMRGVVSLAAALALPSDFEARDLIVFLAFCAILSTLVLQGTTLKWLIQWFDLREPDIAATSPALVEARAIVAGAIAGVGAHASGTTDDVLAQVRWSEQVAARTGHVHDPERLRAIMRERLATLDDARVRLRKHREALDGETLATLIRELDLEEEQVRLALGDTEQVPV